uniref:Cytochrome c oxidase subunit 2 n=1 Tax=Aphrocallistes vastus TaxID=83887 RepID=B2BRQ4_APHVA|nr:cytochrome c oxidase subunit II [Aphrocallistes vastus]ABR58848.1 cytochrome c oxidase subunit 2 [Aphrocallistes vastus]
MNILIKTALWKDLPEKSQINFQDPASPTMEQIILLHDYSMFFLTNILLFITWIIIKIMTIAPYNKNITENIKLETIWTTLPAFILLTIAFPSLKLLYITDEVIEPELTIKTTGNQWYWTYEYSDYENNKIEIESYMTPIDDLEMRDNSLLEVNNQLLVPTNTNIRILITAADVLHSFTVPSLGIKADAIPGRLNQVNFLISRPGIFYGQCSELCGANHSFMPIAIQGTTIQNYRFFIHSTTDTEKS